MKKIFKTGMLSLLVFLLLLPIVQGMDKNDKPVAEDILVVAGIPFAEREDLGIQKPSWKEIEEILPTLKEVGVNAIFIWAPYEHRITKPGETITAYTEKGEIELELSHCVHIKDYLKPDPDRGSEEDFLHMIATAHSLGIKVILQLQITVAIPGDFVYDEHLEWILKSIYDTPVVNWPWPPFSHGFTVNKAHPVLINYVTNIIIPHWIKNWSVDGIYLDSPGMAYCDLYIKELCENVGCAPGYECLTPVDGYYTPEPLVKAMKNKIEQLGKEVGKDLIFPAEACVKTWRDMPDDIIIKACKGEPYAYQIDPRVDRSLGEYFDWVLSYNFRAVLKNIYEKGEASYSKNYVDFLRMIENELEGKYTETAKFVNMWNYFHKYTYLLDQEIADCFITLQVTAPGKIVWIGVYQLPPQDDIVGEYFGYNSSFLKHWYAKLVEIKREHHALHSSNIEDALIWPKIKGVIAYNRWDENESITVVVNVNDKPVNCKLKTRFKGERVKVYDVLSGEKFGGDPENLEVEVPAYTPKILVEKQPVEVEIRKPKEKYLYIFDREVMPFFNTVIIGKVNVEVDASDEDGIERVEFYVNDVLKFTDYDEPYQWQWNEFSFGKYEIKVVAHDNEGNKAEDRINVITINLFARCKNGKSVKHNSACGTSLKYLRNSIR